MLKRVLPLSLALVGAAACAKTPLDIASEAGIPPVSPESGVAGPLEGPDGVIFYANAQGLVSIWVPEGPVAVFADAGAGTVYFVATPLAQYVVEQDQLVQVPQLPQEVYLFPHANGLAQGLIQAATAIRDRGGADASALGHQAASEMSRRIHETNMSIIQNIGGGDCTRHYEDGAYVGCW